MLKESQIKQILQTLKQDDTGFRYSTTDRDIQEKLYDVSPYVVGFKREIRGFYCQGLSDLGKSLLD